MSLADALEGKKWEAAAPLITSGAAREKTEDGDLPLHVAARNQVPAEVVAQLVAAYPEAAREKGKSEPVASQQKPMGCGGCRWISDLALWMRPDHESSCSFARASA